MTTTELSFPKDKMRILLLEGVHQSAVDLLREAGYTNIDYRTGALNEDELSDIIAEYHFLGIRSRTQLTAKVFSKAKKLLAVGCFCVGTNQVDSAAARAQAIPVFHAPYSNTRSVAELVIGEVIMLMRGIAPKNMAAHRGQWHKSAKGSFEVRGKTLGIIGYGHIGSQVGILAEQLGMNVRYYDIIDRLPYGNAESCKNLNELLGLADVVTLHVPDSKETRDMIGLTQLRQMKKGAHLINASRGKVVVIEALRQVLEEGHLGGAALDVFPKEPKSKDEAFESPLRGLEQVILTPHIGGSTLEAQENIGKEVAAKLIAYSDNGSTTSAVNFVHANLPAFSDRHRFLHMHENRPGMLTAINEVISGFGINVGGQYLQTDAETGYVIIDTDPHPDSEKLLDALKNIPGTIRARALY